jgi:hypothetical protein
LFLPAPLWFEAEMSPWTCMRDTTPRVLDTTDRCTNCPRWEGRFVHADRRSATPSGWFEAGLAADDISCLEW